MESKVFEMFRAKWLGERIVVYCKSGIAYVGKVDEVSTEYVVLQSASVYQNGMFDDIESVSIIRREIEAIGEFDTSQERKAINSVSNPDSIK